MALPARLKGVLDWLLEGYPTGVPSKDYIPLLALLRRRLTEDEVRDLAEEIAARGGDLGDVGVGITKITDALPSESDIARVQSRLESVHGWPDDPA